MKRRVLLAAVGLASLFSPPPTVSAEPVPAPSSEYDGVIAAARDASQVLKGVLAAETFLRPQLQSVSDWYTSQDDTSQWMLAVTVSARTHQMEDTLDVAWMRTMVSRILSRFITTANMTEQRQAEQSSWITSADVLERLNPVAVPDSNSTGVSSLSLMVGLYERLDWKLGILASELSNLTQVPADELFSVWRTTTLTRLQVLFVALDKLGVPYRAYADGPDAYDCSGFTSAAWREGGVSLPSYSVSQQAVTTTIAQEELETSDLVFYKPLWSDSRNTMVGHVSLYLGSSNLVIESTGRGVSLSRYREQRISGYGSVITQD